MLTNTVWALLSHPSQYKAVLSHPHLLTQAIEEALRWEPPVQSCTRFVMRPVVVQGVELAPGEMVQCMVGAANRDPEHFTDPDAFDLERANARDHLSFATGKHFCLGAALARLEGEVEQSPSRYVLGVYSASHLLARLLTPTAEISNGRRSLSSRPGPSKGVSQSPTANERRR
jgi:hypothetical protein